MNELGRCLSGDDDDCEGLSNAAAPSAHVTRSCKPSAPGEHTVTGVVCERTTGGGLLTC